jgi:hypothetical protein
MTVHLMARGISQLSLREPDLCESKDTTSNAGNSPSLPQLLEPPRLLKCLDYKARREIRKCALQYSTHKWLSKFTVSDFVHCHWS